MAGTKSGGEAAAKTNKLKYGPDFYKRIGTAGGKIGRTGGFGNGEKGRELARLAGKKGGEVSRRPKSERI